MTLFSPDIAFSCPICQFSNVITLEVAEVRKADGAIMPDTPSQYDVISCRGCSASISIEYHTNNGSFIVELEDFPETVVAPSWAQFSEYDEYDYKDLWIVEDIPSDPERMIMSTLADIRRLLGDRKDAPHSATLMRMAFAQQVSVMEAYLSDTLITEVNKSESALAGLIKDDRELKDRKITLLDSLTKPDIVKGIVAQYLREQLYHNLSRVESLYDLALHITLFPSTDVRSRLNKAMPVRHDCVHRNGKDKQGNARTDVTYEYVMSIERDILALVEHVEEELKNSHWL